MKFLSAVLLCLIQIEIIGSGGGGTAVFDVLDKIAGFSLHSDQLVDVKFLSADKRK